MKRSLKYSNLEVLDAKADGKYKLKKRNSGEGVNGSSQYSFMRDLEVMATLLSSHGASMKVCPCDEVENESNFTSLADYAKYRADKINSLDSSLFQSEVTTHTRWSGSDDSNVIENASKAIQKEISVSEDRNCFLPRKDYPRKLSTPDAKVNNSLGMLKDLFRRSMSLSNEFTFHSRSKVDNHMDTAVVNRRGRVEISSVRLR